MASDWELDGDDVRMDSNFNSHNLIIYLNNYHNNYEWIVGPLHSNSDFNNSNGDSDY